MIYKQGKHHLEKMTYGICDFQSLSNMDAPNVLFDEAEQ